MGSRFNIDKNTTSTDAFPVWSPFCTIYIKPDQPGLGHFKNGKNFHKVLVSGKWATTFILDRSSTRSLKVVGDVFLG